MKKFGNLLWGIVFIALGIIFGLNALNITDINIFFDGWWTLFLIIPSFIDLFKRQNKTSNIIVLIIGIALLLCSQDILNFDTIWKLLIPFILIVIGLSIIFKDLFNNEVNKQIKKLNDKINKESDYCATFGNQFVKLDDEEFKGSVINSIFGSVKLDLRKSIIKSDCVINSTSIFGGVTILVPKNVKVKIKSTPIFGGVEDKTKQEIEKNAKTIYINATCIFGGLDIK